MYERCGSVVESYVKRHPEEWILGGPGSIVIVDEFPGGYMTENFMDNTNFRKRNNNSHTILCIAETNFTATLPATPPRMWLHMIQGNPMVNSLYKIKLEIYYFLSNLDLNLVKVKMLQIF